MICDDFIVDAIPVELRDVPQWVCWHLETRDGKFAKVPLNPHTGGHAKVSDPRTWGDFDTALDAARRHGWGVGVVFTAFAGLTGVDLDHCRDPQTGALAPWARVVLNHLRSYCEVSPSGTGVKVFLRGTLARAKGRRRGPIELYSEKRYFTVTGQRLGDYPADVCERQAELDALAHRLFPPQPSVPAKSGGPTIGDDAELIAHAMRARNFARLWRGDTTGYASPSEADCALAAHLAFWTHRDPARIDRLFRASGLYRPKWDRPDYRARTIARVLH